MAAVSVAHAGGVAAAYICLHVHCWCYLCLSLLVLLLPPCRCHAVAKCVSLSQLLDEYFGKDDELDPAGAFLKSYIANKAWKEPNDGGFGGGSRKKKRIKGLDGSDSSSSSEDEGDDADSSGSGSDEEGSGDVRQAGGGGMDDEEDEEFLEEVDRFEAAYNFR